MSEVIENSVGYEIEGPYGFVPFKALFVSDEEDGYVFELDSGKTIKVSADHVFINLDGTPIKSSEIEIGMDLGFGKIIDTKNTTKKVHIGPLSVACGEYLTTDGVRSHNCEFIGSSTTLISPQALDSMKATDPIGYKYGWSMKIFENPVQDGFYVMGVDAATGTGKDYAVIQVLRIYGRSKYEQVAVYADNNTRPTNFAKIITEISEMYNNAMAIVESNEVGSEVLNELVFTYDSPDLLLNTDDGDRLGTRATKASKVQACMNLKTLLDDNQLKINDIDTIKELAIFEEVAPSIFKAPRNKHDDRVSALYWAGYALLQPQIDLDDLNIHQTTDEEIYSPMWFDV